MKRSTVFVAIGSAGALALAGAATGQAQSGGSLPAVTMTMSPSAIAVGGDLRSGAVSLSVSNAAKDAEPTIVRLNPGVTADQLLAGVSRIQDPNDVTPYGSIVFDADAPKGTTTFQTVLEPGNYVALDTQGNPAKSPHAAFTVAANAQPASLPKAPTVSAIDFGFKAPKSIKAGSTVRFRNDGWVVHMIDGIQVKNAKAARRLTALLKAGKDKPAQKLALGFASFLGPASHGAVQQLKVTAKPGVYVLACFMSTQDGREHTRLGMLKTIRVKR